MFFPHTLSKQATDYILKNTSPLVPRKKIFLVANIVPAVFFINKKRKNKSSVCKYEGVDNTRRLKKIENLNTFDVL